MNRRLVPPDSILHQPLLNLLESGHRVRFRDTPQKKSTFAKDIETQRKERRLTVENAAKLVPISARTWRRWKSGEVIPPVRTQTAVLMLLEKKGAPTSPRLRSALKNSHHLHWEKHKGWVLRVTIEVNAKKVGVRRKFPLGTKDLDEALKERKTVLMTLRRLGLKVRPRIHRPMKRPGASATA